MPGKYFISYNFQKQKSYQIGWEAIEEFLLIFQSFNMYLCFLSTLFMESLSFSYSVCSQFCFVFFPKAGFRFFPNDIPACFPGFLSAFQWLAPGQQMVQMAYYIFPGLMKRNVRNLTALAWCLIAEKAAQKWQWLEIILIKIIWSLLSLNCCFYPSSSLHLHNLGFLPWKHTVSKLDTTVS